jgi:hypothetical protein
MLGEAVAGGWLEKTEHKFSRRHAIAKPRANSGSRQIGSIFDPLGSLKLHPKQVLEGTKNGSTEDYYFVRYGFSPK